MAEGEVETDMPALAYTIQQLATAGQVLDALGAYYLTAPCACGIYSQGLRNGWGVITVDGVQLHLCGDCARPSNRDNLLPGDPYAKGDVAYWCRMLWVLDGAPGPTGCVQVHPLDGTDADQITLHVLQLNQED